MPLMSIKVDGVWLLAIVLVFLSRNDKVSTFDVEKTSFMNIRKSRNCADCNNIFAPSV